MTLLATTSSNDVEHTILFVVFMCIFCATATITILGIIGKLQIRDGFLKALFTALILEVVGIIVALGRNELLPTPPPPEDYQVWTVMGKMDMSKSHLSPSGVPTVAIEVLPKPSMDSNGIFTFFVAAPRKTGTYDLPTIRFVDSGASSSNVDTGASQLRDIPLNAKWDQYDEVKIDRDIVNHIATISPFSLKPIPIPSTYTKTSVEDVSEHGSKIPLKLITASDKTQPSPAGNQQTP
jgi:hypothetical protein